MTLPRAKIPFTSKSVKKLVSGPDLISLIVPVEEGLRKFDQIHEDVLVGYTCCTNPIAH
jgi:hypothetical protein